MEGKYRMAIRFGEVIEVAARPRARNDFDWKGSYDRQKAAVEKVRRHYTAQGEPVSKGALFPHLNNSFVVITGDDFRAHKPHDQALKDFCRILHEDAPQERPEIPQTLEGNSLESIRAAAAKILADAPRIIDEAAKKAFAPLKHTHGGSWKELLEKRITLFAEDILAARDVGTLIALAKTLPSGSDQVH